MTTELATRPSAHLLPAAGEWALMSEMAKALFESRLLPKHITNPYAALAIIQKGRELGIQPMYALSRIAMIEGKPSADAELMAALIYRDHGDNALRFVESNDRICTIEYRRRAGQPARHSFTIEEAQRAKLTGKDNWSKYPAAMLRARCVSAVARMAFPDAIGGMYTPEELGADVAVDEHGEMTVSDVTPNGAPSAEIIEPSQQEQQHAEVAVNGEPIEGFDREALLASWAVLIEEAEKYKVDGWREAKARNAEKWAPEVLYGSVAKLAALVKDAKDRPF